MIEREGPSCPLEGQQLGVKPMGLAPNVSLSSQRPQKHPKVCHLPPQPHMTLFLSLFPSLTINTPTHPSALHTTLLFSPIPTKPLFLSSPSSHPTTPLLPQNGHQKIKQTASSSHSEANSQEVLKLRKETTRLRWTRPSFGRPKGPFCCICWRKQKQKHCPNLLLDSPWVPNPSAAGRRRIWLQPRDGYHNPLRRRSFSVSNIHAQMKIRQAAAELVFFFEKMA